MRWILLILIITSATFCGARRLIALSDNNAETFWDWMPGENSNRVTHLAPELRADLKWIISALEREGFRVEVVTTWRSPLRQRLIYAYGRLRHWAGLGQASLAGPDSSCHARTNANGRPESMAVDLRLKDNGSLSRHADFFHRLGHFAIQRKLIWGGNWRQSNTTWRSFGLGWDPGHIEHSGCRLTHQ